MHACVFVCVCERTMEDLSFGHRGGDDPLVILVSPEGTPPSFFLQVPFKRIGRLNNLAVSFVCHQH